MNLEYEKLLKAFLEAEDRWLEGFDFGPPTTSRARDKIDRSRVVWKADELRDLAKKLGPDYEKHAEYHLGKNFGRAHFG